MRESTHCDRRTTVFVRDSADVIPQILRILLSGMGTLLRTLVKSTAVVVLFTSFFSMALVDIYIWTDENGKKHFSDRKTIENVDVKEIATKPRQSSAGPSDENDQGSTVDVRTQCSRSLRACEAQYRSEYSYRVSLCKGDWSAAAAIGNAMYGGS